MSCYEDIIAISRCWNIRSAGMLLSSKLPVSLSLLSDLETALWLYFTLPAISVVEYPSSHNTLIDTPLSHSTSKLTRYTWPKTSKTQFAHNTPAQVQTAHSLNLPSNKQYWALHTATNINITVKCDVAIERITTKFSIMNGSALRDRQLWLSCICEDVVIPTKKIQALITDNPTVTKKLKWVGGNYSKLWIVAQKWTQV